MIGLGLIGYPIGHSLSPLLHKTMLDASGLRGEYSCFPVSPGEGSRLETLVGRIRTGELDGLNVTIPHKQAVMRFVDELTAAAAAIGAVNTLYSREGKVIGDNTDASGFLKDLERFLPSPTSALVLGAGGAARAVVHALGSRDCSVAVAARRPEQAEELARRFPGVRPMSMAVDALASEDPDLLVHATPAGMAPNVNENIWPVGLAMPKRAAVYDLVYNPPVTRLIRSAREAGLRASNGLGMLIEQAALAFELWTGVAVDRQLLVDTVQQQAG